MTISRNTALIMGGGVIAAFLILFLSAPFFSGLISGHASKDGNTYFERLSREKQQELESASAAQVVQIYFEALKNKDYDLCLATLSPNALYDSDGNQYVKQWEHSLKQITAISDPEIRISRVFSSDKIDFEVLFNQSSLDPAMNGNPFDRWFTVVRNNPQDRFRIDSIASSP